MKKQKRRYTDIDPDEIFLDSSNIPKFNEQQFEGRIEQSIGKGVSIYTTLFFLLCIVLLLYRAFSVSVIDGEKFRAQSENNMFRSIPLFTNRGVIKDRNGELLAYNQLASSTASSPEIPRRIYTQRDGLSHILGFVSYPKKDSKGTFWQENFIGRDGLEKQYDTALSGTPGKRLLEVNAHGEQISSSLIEQGKEGQPLVLSIDAKVQEKLFQEIKSLALKAPFIAGAGAIMDIHTGEMIALTSYPEYSSNLITNTPESPLVKAYFTRKDAPLLNRMIAGLYAPGSTVKPFMALAALGEDSISPSKKIDSPAFITIHNPYGGADTIFRDWKTHGTVDMREAIAASSDIYFYTIGGGYGSNKGLGIDTIDRYMKAFRVGEATGIDLSGERVGVIPNKEWKAKMFPKDPKWNIGNTYHTSIGQYGFQVTPIALLRATAAIARDGVFVTPHLLLGEKGEETGFDIQTLEKQDYTVIREGMRGCVNNPLRGTCQALRIEGVSVAAKSGTAEVGIQKSQTNSWITGFFPYETPRYAFVVVMEKGNRNNTFGASLVMKEVLLFMLQQGMSYTQK